MSDGAFSASSRFALGRYSPGESEEALRAYFQASIGITQLQSSNSVINNACFPDNERVRYRESLEGRPRRAYDMKDEYRVLYLTHDDTNDLSNTTKCHLIVRAKASPGHHGHGTWWTKSDNRL